MKQIEEPEMEMKDDEILMLTDGVDIAALTPEEFEAIKKRVKAIEKKHLEDLKNGKIKRSNIKAYLES